jgi:hypothetical protein
MLLLDKAESAEIPLCARQVLPQWKQPLSAHKLAVQAAFTFAPPKQHLIIEDGRRSNHTFQSLRARRSFTGNQDSGSATPQAILLN